MFSLYHSLQKQLSRAVLVVHAFVWGYILGTSSWYPPWRHPAFVFPGNYIWCTIIFHSWKATDLWNNVYSVNHEQITSNFSCKYHRAANAKIVEHWSNLGQYFPKKERKSRYKSNFQRVSLRRQIVCLWICHVTFLERTLRFGFLITLETLSFFSLKSSLEFIIITPHNMQKRTRSKERTKLYGPSRQYLPRITQPVSNPAWQGLTWVLLNWASQGLLRDTYV